MRQVGFTEIYTVYLRTWGPGVSFQRHAPQTRKEERQLDIIEIKNLTTNEILTLKEDLIKELKFREGIGRDIELLEARKLKTILEKDLTQQEMMSDRVLVRNELNEVKKDISRLQKENSIQNLMEVLKDKN